MLRPHEGAWLQDLSGDFRQRFLRLLPGPFASFPVRLALSVVGVPGEDPPLGLPPVQPATLLQFLTRHDLHRLERYSANMADYHNVTDLVPPLAELFFLRRLHGVHMSFVQAAVLLAVGRQNRPVEDVARELGAPLNQVLALFGKAITKLHAHLKKLLERTEQPEEAADLGARLGTVRKSLGEEQEEAAREVQKHLKATKRSLQKSLQSGEFAMPGEDESPKKRRK